MRESIDLGHGVNYDGGAIGRIEEETIINEVGTLVISKLKALGDEVLSVRPSSATSLGNSLSQRCTASNNFNADIFVSLHANAGGGRGVEIYTYGGKNLDAAQRILDNIVALGFRNRGIKDGSKLYVIRNTVTPAMLIEICFVDTDDVDIYNRVGANAIADAIVKGLKGTTINTTPVETVETSKNKPYEYGVVTAKSGLKIRKGPGTGYDELGILKYGEKVHIDFEEDGWFSVFWGDHGGFISSEFVEEYKEVDNWIARLQTACNEQGFSSQTVDGIPGSNTLAGCPLLRYGAVGEITKLLQEKLGVTADGIFGNDTRAAVVAFQRKHNLSADGIVGRNTWGVLLGI